MLLNITFNCLSSLVVVVHSCKLQGHIKHEWEGYLGDVGQRCKAKKSWRSWTPTPSWQIREGLAPQSGQTLLNGRASTHIRNPLKIKEKLQFTTLNYNSDSLHPKLWISIYVNKILNVRVSMSHSLECKTCIWKV